MGDYMGDHIGVITGDTKSLDGSSYIPIFPTKQDDLTPQRRQADRHDVEHPVAWAFHARTKDSSS